MIRLIKKEDIDDISNLLAQVNLVHHLGRSDLFKKNNKYTKEELLNMIDDYDNPIFVYEKDGKVIGHAFCQKKIIKENNLLNGIKTLYIDDICVDENSRGNGVATKLYEYVKCYAKDNGYYNITLNVWSFNDNAYKFYEKMGLKPQKITMEEIL